MISKISLLVATLLSLATAGANPCNYDCILYRSIVPNNGGNWLYKIGEKCCGVAEDNKEKTEA